MATESQPSSPETDQTTKDGNTSATLAEEDPSNERNKQLGASSKHHKHGKIRLQERIRAKKIISCKECGAQFSRLGNLAQHQKIHLGEFSVTCYECGKQFRKKSQLEIHKKTHDRKYYGVRSVSLGKKKIINKVVL